MINIRVAVPHGFCAGVERAIAIVNKVVDKYPPPIYVRHEVVHNRFVVDSLKKRGVIFVEELDEVPDGAVTIFSAHGVSKCVRENAIARKLQVFDATCPLVTKVHIEVEKLAKSQKKVIMIGHKGHPEVEGTIGQLPPEQMFLVESVSDVDNLIGIGDDIGYVTQTTLSQDDTQIVVNKIKQHFPKVTEPKKNDICYATQNRQDAIKAIAVTCDVILIIGSKNSSNSNRLREVAEKNNCPAYLIDSANELDIAWLSDKKNIGISAGASAPEVLVEQLINYLKDHYTQNKMPTQILYENVVIEDVKFPLPIELLK